VLAEHTRFAAEEFSAMSTEVWTPLSQNARRLGRSQSQAMSIRGYPSMGERVETGQSSEHARQGSSSPEALRLGIIKTALPKGFGGAGNLKPSHVQDSKTHLPAVQDAAVALRTRPNRCSSYR
jgi:hypothetical protein